MTQTPAARVLPALAATAGFVAVALGAFGAHGLEGRVSPASLETWATATHYLMWHALAIFCLIPLAVPWRTLACLLTGAGLFSLALYLWVLTGIGWLPILAPIGGLLMLTGWALTIWRFLSTP